MVDVNDGSIRINLRRIVDDSYDVVFGENLFPRIAQDLKEKRVGRLKKASRFVIITDSNVKPLYGESLWEELNRQGLQVYLKDFPAGEKHKIRETKAEIEDWMIGNGFGRDTAVLALGGGVVGDLAGLVAATYCRGIPYIQIPTTVLAQADSAIGGKTAVDHPLGKNLIGAFYQPVIVYVDVATLRTLPDIEYSNGLAETVKHGVIQDRKFFDYLRDNTGMILEKSAESSLVIARNNCRIKGNVVEQDLHEESGIRMILNYGHTAGHAIEELSGYQLGHGQCVAIGMMVAGRIAVALGTGFTENDLQMQDELLDRMGLRTAIPAGMPVGDIRRVSERDKKAVGGQVMYVLPSGRGSMCSFGGRWSTHVEDEVVIEALEKSR